MRVVHGSVLPTLVGGGRPNHHSAYFNYHSIITNMVKIIFYTLFAYKLTTTHIILGRTLT